MSIEKLRLVPGEAIVAPKPAAALWSKRMFDVVGSLAIGSLAIPVMIVVAVCIRLTGSPVIFAHKRVGLDRKLFNCYKFRSMVPDAERVLQDLLIADPEKLREWRDNYKLRDDPRVTKLGAFLRASSLDELPQLWNVLRGEMSLVGPRPIVEDELKKYGSKAHSALSVKPGITGLWQVMGRSDVSYSRRVSLDVWYVGKQSIIFDAWILLKTVVVVIKRVGAH